MKQMQVQRTQEQSQCSLICNKRSKKVQSSMTFAVRHFAHQRRVVFECSGAAPVQTNTSLLGGSMFSAVLLRLVMQVALRAVLKV